MTILVFTLGRIDCNKVLYSLRCMSKFDDRTSSVAVTPEVFVANSHQSSVDFINILYIYFYNYDEYCGLATGMLSH